MEKIVYNVQEVSEMLGISRSHVYKLIQDEVIPTLDVGNRKIIPKKKFEEWVNGKES